MDSSRKHRPLSLRARLTLFAIVTLMISLGLVGLALNAAYQRSAEMSLQQQMETWAYMLMASMEIDAQGEISLLVQPADPVLLQPGSGVYASIRTDTARWESSSSLGETLPTTTALSPGEQRFSAAGDGDAYYRQSYGLNWEVPDADAQQATVTVLVNRSWLLPALQAYQKGLWWSLLAAGLLLALAQAVFSVISLRPLRQAAADVARLEAGESTSLDGPYARELEPLRRNIDRLLRSEQANQKKYRSALDSLAHSLKTPLAVIRAGLSAADRQPENDTPASTRGQTGTSARQDMAQAVDDMQYLIASRLERAAAGTRRALSAPVTVAPVVERVAGTLRKVHSQDLRSLDVTIEPGLQFFGEERDLLELTGNLLENACKYGNGQVRLSAGRLVEHKEAARHGLWLRVENDAAPGAEPVDLDRFLQRGQRGDERVEGHGLGLTIVSELVSAYGGEMLFERSELGGAAVLLKLP